MDERQGASVLIYFENVELLKDSMSKIVLQFAIANPSS